jgi:type VI secretion system secreted protein VgrG
MPQPTPNDILATFTITGVTEKLHVIECEGHEGISELFEFHLLLITEKAALDPEKVLRKKAVLTIQGADESRTFHGIVGSVSTECTSAAPYTSRVVLVPAVSLLRHRQNCDIFSKMKLGDILKVVLGGATDVIYQLQEVISPEVGTIEYCVQYQESDWAFVSRLLERYGFYYFFQHTKDKHTLVIGDSSQLYPNIPTQGTISLATGRSLLPSEFYVQEIYFTEGVRTGKYTLADYNPATARVVLKQVASVPGEKQVIESYEHPGDFLDTNLGKRMARVRLEEALALKSVGEGMSDCIYFTSGHRFNLDAGEAGKSTQLLVRVHHVLRKAAAASDEELAPADVEAPRPVARQASASPEAILDDRLQYHNTFLCIPAGTVYRPPRLTPKPHARGVQTAMVTAGADADTYSDSSGRVKVKFHWAPDKESCWMRASQLMTGPQGSGALWLPRIDEEVLVDFVDGDLDRPIIVGRVYNSANPPPLTLPDNRTKSCIKSFTVPGAKGYNEISFEDKKGEELLDLRAEQTLRLETKKGRYAVLDDKNEKIEIASDNGDMIQLANKPGDPASCWVKITTHGGHSLELTDANKKIEVKTKGGITITLDDSGKKLEAKTSSGNKVVLDDTSKKLQVMTAGGMKVVLDDSAKKLEVATASGQKVVLDDSSSKVSVSSLGSLELKAVGSLEISAAQISVKASATLNLEASGLTNIKGALVNLN